MQRLTLGILRNYSAAYDYNLTEEQLKEAYKELTWGDGIVNENDIFDEFEFVLN